MQARSFTIFAALTTMVLIASAAFAATKPSIQSTPAPTAAKPNWNRMNFLVGSWTCSVKSSRRPSAYITTSTTSLDTSGYWMITKSIVHKTSWIPTNINSTDMLTFDSDLHRWVDISTGDFGGYGVMTSPGWSGDSVVWTDALFKPGMDIVAETPIKETKISDSRYTGYSTFQERKSGAWVTVNTVCNKNSSGSM